MEKKRAREGWISKSAIQQIAEGYTWIEVEREREREIDVFVLRDGSKESLASSHNNNPMLKTNDTQICIYLLGLIWFIRLIVKVLIILSN